LVSRSAETAEELRAALERRRREHGLDQAELKVRHGDPGEQMAIEQAEGVYELLIVAGAQHGARQDERLSSAVVRLLERPQGPVLVTAGEADTLERVLICTAAGEPGKSDVRVGGWLARRLQVPATLLYVTRAGHDPTPATRAHLDQAAATLRALDVPAEVQVRAAPSAAQGILVEAQAGGYGLTVIGSHGPQSRSVLSLDDVTLQVLAGADRPILIVPAEE
jgi:nucleotide-binding universal stress UspA family protein